MDKEVTCKLVELEEKTGENYMSLIIYHDPRMDKSFSEHFFRNAVVLKEIPNKYYILRQEYAGSDYQYWYVSNCKNCSESSKVLDFNADNKFADSFSINFGLNYISHTKVNLEIYDEIAKSLDIELVKNMVQDSTTKIPNILKEKSSTKN